MSVFLRLRCLFASTLCAALAACAGGPSATGVSRTAPPQDYETTIGSFFAFKLPGPQKNTTLGVGAPEPGDCALGGYSASVRGWVVPVVYRTFSGELNGKDTIQINEKQYYFWFSSNTIAGITRRRELCPGLGTVFGDSDLRAAPVAQSVPAGLDASARPETSPRVAAPNDAKPARAKGGTAQRTKKSAAPRKKVEAPS